MGCIDLMTLVGGGTEIPHDRRGRKYIPHKSQMDDAYAPRVLTRLTRPITPVERKPDRKKMVARPDLEHVEAVPRGKFHIYPEMAQEIKLRGIKITTHAPASHASINHLTRDEYSEKIEMGRKKRVEVAFTGPRVSSKQLQFDYLNDLYPTSGSSGAGYRVNVRDADSRRYDDGASSVCASGRGGSAAGVGFGAAGSAGIYGGSVQNSRPMSAKRMVEVTHRQNEERRQERASVQRLSTWVPPEPAFQLS